MVFATGGGMAEMRLWIGTDMEGVSGVINREYTGDGGSFYREARRWLTNEVNAVARAAFGRGASEIVVADTHGTCHNIDREELHPRVDLINGKVASLPNSAVVGLEAEFDAVILVGYHVRAGRHPGLMDHTAWAQTVAEVRINGDPVGETELVAGYAGSLGVPTLAVLGDDVLAEDVRRAMPGVRPVVTKRAVNRFTARHESPEIVYRRIEEEIGWAIEGRGAVEPFAFETPVTIELLFKHPSYAELAEMVPLCDRTGLDTVAFTGESYAGEIYPAFCSMCGISGIAAYQGA